VYRTKRKGYQEWFIVYISGSQTFSARGTLEKL